MDKLDYIVGGGWNTYEGRHYGKYGGQNTQVTALWAMSTTMMLSKLTLMSAEKGFYNYSEQLTLFGDVQQRTIDYSFIGKDDNGNALEDTVDFSFFNPKFGGFYQIDNRVVRLPHLPWPTESPIEVILWIHHQLRPVHETLYDTEMGYKLKRKNYAISATAYYMIYDNQLILTGKINDVGEYTRENVGYSERRGIEIEGGIKINNKWDWSGNISMSQNTIASYTIRG